VSIRLEPLTAAPSRQMYCAAALRRRVFIAPRTLADSRAKRTYYAPRRRSAFTGSPPGQIKELWATTAPISSVGSSLLRSPS
jgi:hypothetical protein